MSHTTAPRTITGPTRMTIRAYLYGPGREPMRRSPVATPLPSRRESKRDILASRTRRAARLALESGR